MKVQRGTFVKGLMKGLHIAVLMMAVAVLLVPRVRTDLGHTMLKSAMMVECAISVFRSWRRGFLSNTPSQIYRRTLAGDGPFYTRLEMTALTLGWIALGVLLFK